MLNNIIKRNFSCKLYSNVANLQKQKSFKFNFDEFTNESKKETVTSQKEILNALKNSHEKIKQSKDYEKKTKEQQNQISDILKSVNKISYKNLNQTVKFNREKSSQSIKIIGETSEFLHEKFYDLYESNLKKNELKKQIANYEDIIDLSNKLSNEKYSLKAKETSTNLKKIDEKKLYDNSENTLKGSVLRKSHLYEFYYNKLPFCNTLLAPNKFRDPFSSMGKENQELVNEYDHEVECLNSEIHKLLTENLEKEMEKFQLQDIKSNNSVFKDNVKNKVPLTYMIEESNRGVDYDEGIELERLYYTVNKEDDFGVTMYKEEGEKKKPKEASGIREKEENKALMRTSAYFPFVVDKKGFTLMRSNLSL